MQHDSKFATGTRYTNKGKPMDNIQPGNHVDWYYMESDPENGPDCDELSIMGGIVQAIWENSDLDVLSEDGETVRVKRKWLTNFSTWEFGDSP